MDSVEGQKHVSMLLLVLACFPSIEFVPRLFTIRLVPRLYSHIATVVIFH
jgi:hypothetical protein